MTQQVDSEVLIESYREDFVDNSELWKKRKDITNSIIEETIEDLAPERDFTEYTFNEYCALCEANFRRLIEDVEIGYDSDEIITSKYYCDIMDYAQGDHEDAFRLAVEKHLNEKLDKFYASVNQENFFSAMKEKCGDLIGEEDFAALIEIWEKNI